MSVKSVLVNNWDKIGLIIVGSLALVIYYLQERRKISEAASLIIQQIDELQERIKEIQSYIVNEQLDSGAFYESQIIFSQDYWNQYKHFFIRRIDSKSYRILNEFYDCVTEIREQQKLMKDLQKNFFFITQQVIANLESYYIIGELYNSRSYTVAMPNRNVDFSIFWKQYEENRTNILTVINQRGLTPYIPDQIRTTLNNALKQYALLEIIGSDGYKKLEKLSHRKR